MRRILSVRRNSLVLLFMFDSESGARGGTTGKWSWAVEGRGTLWKHDGYVAVFNSASSSSASIGIRILDLGVYVYLSKLIFRQLLDVWSTARHHIILMRQSHSSTPLQENICLSHNSPTLISSIQTLPIFIFTPLNSPGAETLLLRP
jgi:hypothetical protein